MIHECRAETLPLVLVDHSESDLGLSRLHDDVTCAARDHGPAAFVNYCDQRDVIHEVDVQETPDFRLGEVASYSKETTVEGDRTAATDGCEEVGPVVRSESADFDRAPIAQRLKCRIVGWFQHHRQLFTEPYQGAAAAAASCDGKSLPLEHLPRETVLKNVCGVVGEQTPYLFVP